MRKLGRRGGPVKLDWEWASSKDGCDLKSGLIALADGLFFLDGASVSLRGKALVFSPVSSIPTRFPAETALPKTGGGIDSIDLTFSGSFLGLDPSCGGLSPATAWSANPTWADSEGSAEARSIDSTERARLDIFLLWPPSIARGRVEEGGGGGALTTAAVDATATVEPTATAATAATEATTDDVDGFVGLRGSVISLGLAT